MADDPDGDERVAVEDLTPEEASRIIHSHRKVRYGKPSIGPLTRLSSFAGDCFSQAFWPS
jgi:hypothetical protein